MPLTWTAPRAFHVQDICAHGRVSSHLQPHEARVRTQRIARCNCRSATALVPTVSSRSHTASCHDNKSRQNSWPRGARHAAKCAALCAMADNRKSIADNRRSQKAAAPLCFTLLPTVLSPDRTGNHVFANCSIAAFRSCRCSAVRHGTMRLRMHRAATRPSGRLRPGRCAVLARTVRSVRM